MVVVLVVEVLCGEGWGEVVVYYYLVVEYLLFVVVYY